MMTWANVPIEDMMAAWGRLAMEQCQRDVKAIRDLGFPHTAEKVALRAQKETRKLDKVFRGAFLQGWAWESMARGGALVNVAPHAGSVEFGTPPGTSVSLGAILEWTRVKLYGLPPRVPQPALRFGSARPLTRGNVPFVQRTIRSRSERAARRRNRSMDRTAMEEEAYNVARGVVAAIRERGVAPTFIFRNALQGAPADLARWVRKNLPYPLVSF